MKKIHIFGDSGTDIAASDDISFPLMVCSHERSGTHFLMNSIDACTSYTAQPFLNYDIIPLARTVNFFSMDVVSEFFSLLSGIPSGTDRLCIQSIIKSHYAIQLLGDPLPGELKILYIYRNPVDVFISYWRYLHSLNHFEGPKLSTPLDLARHAPAGQSQRYQIRNYHNYFERWAEHVSSAIRLKAGSERILLVKYEDLLANHNDVLKEIFGCFSIPVVNQIIAPDELRSNIIEGSNKEILADDISELSLFCKREIEKFPDLPDDILKSARL